MKGRNIAGMSDTRQRIENDFYATPLEATRMFLNACKFDGVQTILEPSAGQGHISTVLKENFPTKDITNSDLVYRGDPFNVIIEGGIDFLSYEYKEKYDLIMTNPPFANIEKFIEKGLKISNRYVVMFAKIQLLESEKRKDLLKNSPLKYVYVHSKRVNPLRNGSQFDEKGKKWNSTMCFAWFVWDKDYSGEPIIKWL